MAKICYVPRNFKPAVLGLIEQANKIIAEYRQQGFVLTLRQLYYQFVARDLLANTQKNYKNLGSAINDGRLAGLIDWTAIEDRTRGIDTIATWESPTDIVSACASQFRFDKWENQPTRVEVWVEKEALAGVFGDVCKELQVPLLSCRGYTSQSEMWRAGMRLKGYEKGGQETLVLHFGDHDPSGIDMTRDIEDRLRVFGARTEVKRLALNMPQVEEYDPPPNPAKLTDSRFEGYSERFGDESWELDALEPKLLAQLVRTNVEEARDEAKWEDRVNDEDEAKKALSAVAERWDEVVDFVNGG